MRALAAALALALTVAAAPARPRSAPAPAPAHGLSIHGDLKYPPGFAHFAYVNPRAPKGGSVTLSAVGTFDNLNPFILKGVPPAGISMTFDTLTVASADEPSSEYGLVAETIETPADRSWVAFTLRPTARFHDGSPMTVEDVRWTFETLRTKGHPLYRSYYAQVTSAEQTGPRTVRFAFKAGDNRELPVIVGQLPVLSKAYWATHDFTKTTLEPPLGSGPYRVESLEPGRSITYRRVKDYWGAALPVNVGRYNFDTIRYDYYRDDTVALEAFKGGAFDFRQEASSKNWATAYDVPAVRGRPHPEGGDCQRGADRHAGVRLQHAPRDLPRPPRARGAGRGLRLRVEQRPPLLRRLRAHGELLLQLRAGLARPARRRPSWRCWSRCAAAFPRRCSRASTSPPSTDDGRDAPEPRARARAPEAGRLGRARPEAGERRDAASRWPSRSCSTIRTSSASPCRS